MDYSHVKKSRYFDKSGAPVYPKQVIDRFCAAIKSDFYGNPHSDNPESRRTQELIDRVRIRILHFLDTTPDEYDVVFTANATAGLRLVAESFEWYPSFEQARRSIIILIGSSIIGLLMRACLEFVGVVVKSILPAHCIMFIDNHTSAIGIRSNAIRNLARISVCDDFKTTFDHVGLALRYSLPSFLPWRRNSLLVYPLQSNFNGRNYDCKQFVIQCRNSSTLNHRILTCLDASSYCASSPLSLRAIPADFVVLSFYKIFGFPTGLGALLVRRESADSLAKGYFGGGSVDSVITREPWQRFKSGHDQWEDGTVNYHGILALECSFIEFESIIPQMGDYANSLRIYARQRLLNLKYDNGQPAVVLYDNVSDSFGPVLNFNILQPDGSLVSCSDFQKIASESGISVRHGAFCNSGALQVNIGVSEEQIRYRFEMLQKTCSDDYPVYDNGLPSGSIRISFGHHNTRSDIDVLISMIQEFYIVAEMNRNAVLADGVRSFLFEIIVYPIKSCAGYSVQKWKVTETGLLFDRRYKICDAYGRVMTLKKFPKMSLIKVSLDMQTEMMIINGCGMPEIQMSLNEYSDSCVNQWLSDFLNVSCHLVRSKDDGSFCNRSPFLFINKSSFDSVKAKLNLSSEQIYSFRPNLIAANLDKFSEMDVVYIDIGKRRFKALEQCQRCTMINVQNDGSVGEQNVFLDLRKAFGHSYFGRYLALCGSNFEDDSYICCGDIIEISRTFSDNVH